MSAPSAASALPFDPSFSALMRAARPSGAAFERPFDAIADIALELERLPGRARAVGRRLNELVRWHEEDAAAAAEAIEAADAAEAKAETVEEALAELRGAVRACAAKLRAAHVELAAGGAERLDADDWRDAKAALDAIDALVK